MRIGVLGCGNIGQEIVKAVNEGKINVKIVSVFDKDERRIEEISKLIDYEIEQGKDFDVFLKDVNLVVEAASQEAVNNYAKKILSKGKDLIILSVGALSNDELWSDLKKIGKEKGVKIYIPSGAVLGLDGIKAGKMGKIDSISLITRKNPKNIEGMSGLVGEKIIYQGLAREVVTKFPKNINIAATLSLIGVGFEKTKVKIIADSKVEENIHEISIRGNFGDFKIIINNTPSSNNPKTSYLTILSTLATLKEICEEKENKNYVKIGS